MRTMCGTILAAVFAAAAAEAGLRQEGTMSAEDENLRLAAAEFGKFHRLATGREPTPDALSLMIDPYVSKSGRDAYSIVSTASGARVKGSNLRSVFFGIYDLLERRAGCRWFWDGDVVPKRDAIDLSGLDIREEARFEHRAIRWFAHRGLKRFQAEHWGPDDWKREIDWCLKKRLNIGMLRIGQDDLFARAFPGVDPAPSRRGVSGYDDRSPFWPLSFRGSMRAEIQSYGRRRGFLFPEDFGTMTHWYSPTPPDFLEKNGPAFLPQTTGIYARPETLVWDVRDARWADAYWELTKVAVRDWGGGKPEMLHTIGLGERRCFLGRARNFELKESVLKTFLDRAARDFPEAKILLAGWDFFATWTPDEVKGLVAKLDPQRVILWDYESDAVRDMSGRSAAPDYLAEWGVVGKFPYTFSVFLALENGLDARANYPLLEKRLARAASDPMCKGAILWPEASHTDMPLLDWFAECAWTGAASIDDMLPRFCESRYGGQAEAMLPVWRRIVPASRLLDWNGNAPNLFLSGGKTAPGAGEPEAADAPCEDWAAEAAGLPGALRALAEVPWASERLRRDTVDAARCAIDRALVFGMRRFARDAAAWKAARSGNGETLAREADNLAGMLETLADVLDQHEDYSLVESLRALETIHPVPADFPDTLFENAANNYCRGHQAELVRHWCLPLARRWADRVAAAAAAGDRTADLLPPRGEEVESLRLKLKKRGLPALASATGRSQVRFAQACRRAAILGAAVIAESAETKGTAK